MAMAFNDVSSICQEAFYLLRQDASVLTAANWSNGTPIEVAKCRLALETAANEVADAFRWNGGVTADDLAHWPRKVRNALVYCLARELAIPIAGRVEDMKTYDALYRDKLTQAKLADLNAKLAENTDPVLAQLVANFRADDPGLVTAYEVYEQRSATAKEASAAEVARTLDIDLDTEGPGGETPEAPPHLVEALCAAKLAAACGLDAKFTQLKAQEYSAKLAEWRKSKLNRELQAAMKENDDPILAELIANFRSDDPGLVNAFAVYKMRKNTLLIEAKREVSQTLKLAVADTTYLDKNGNNIYTGLDADGKRISVPEYFVVGKDDGTVEPKVFEQAVEPRKYYQRLGDGFARSIVNTLVEAQLATACGLDPSVKQLKMQEYAAKVAEWRRLRLNEALAKNDDPILAELLANFRTDDAGLVNTYDIYANRAELVKATAAVEVNAAHDWLEPFEVGDTTHRAYPAWVDLCCAKLAAACGMDANHIALYDKQYAQRLQTARAADLEAAKALVEDEDTKSVLAMISTNFIAADVTMPRNLQAITNRIDQLKEMARHEVLSSHDWNFAKVVEHCGHCLLVSGSPYRFVTPMPRRALRLVAAYGCDGDLVEWKVEEGYVKARSPIHRLKFTRDVTDFSKWSASARRAYLLRVSAEVARTVLNNAQEAQMQEAKYAQALADAKLRDTREGNTPTDSWGHNYYVDAMRGGHRHRPWGRR